MRKKLFYLLPSILFFIGAPIVWWVCFREVPLKISPQTTFLTEPKTKDGKSIDYFEAIRDRFEPQIEPSQNGFREIVTALGKSPFFDEPDWLWPELCKKLELDPELTPTLQFEPLEMFVHREYLLWLDANDLLGKAADGQLDEDEYPSESGGLLNRLLSRPWTSEQYPFMARWIEENSPILDLIASATEKDYCFLPKIRQPGTEGTLDTKWSVSGPALFPRFLEAGFQCRGQWKIGQADIEGAWSDLIHADRLLIQIRRSFSNNTNYLLFQFQPALRLVKKHPPTQEQRKKFLADLDSLPSWETESDYLEFSRLERLWSAAELGMENYPTNINWNIVAFELNRQYDRLAEMAKEADPEKRNQAIQDYKNEIAKTPSRSMIGRWLGKPLTVSERSKEFSWSVVQTFAVHLRRLSEDNSQRLAELRNLLKNEPGTVSPD